MAALPHFRAPPACQILLARYPENAQFVRPPLSVRYRRCAVSPRAFCLNFSNNSSSPPLRRFPAPALPNIPLRLPNNPEAMTDTPCRDGFQFCRLRNKISPKAFSILRELRR